MLDEEPTFEEYVAARKVVLFVYEQLRQEKYKGQLCIASDEMVSRIVFKSCERFRPDASKTALRRKAHTVRG
jgi:hypothetical protein